jgi:hypothetical protein
MFQVTISATFDIESTQCACSWFGKDGFQVSIDDRIDVSLYWSKWL